MTAEECVNQMAKTLSDMSFGTSNAQIPSDMRDLATAYRDRAVHLRTLILEMGEMVDPAYIPEPFDAIPE